MVVPQFAFLDILADWIEGFLGSHLIARQSKPSSQVGRTCVVWRDLHLGEGVSRDLGDQVEGPRARRERDVMPGRLFVISLLITTVRQTAWAGYVT